MTDEEKAIDEKAKVKAAEMLEKYKDAARLSEELADARNDNFKLRESNRVLKATQVPEKAVVLSESDAARWAAFNELGAPDEIKTRLSNSEAAVAERDELKAEKVISKAASLVGYKVDVLADLSKSKSFSIEVDGENAVAKWRDGDKEITKPLAEYAESALTAYLPALRSDAIAPTSKAVAFPRGAAPGGGEKLSLAEQIRAEESAKKAPVVEAAKAPSLEERMNMAR